MPGAYYTGFNDLMIDNKSKDKYILKNKGINITKYQKIIFSILEKVDYDDLIKTVIKEIEKRSKNPESYEKYISIKKKKSTYYRIYIRNYTIFYTVKNNIMEVRRILYSKRNFNNLV